LATKAYISQKVTRVTSHPLLQHVLKMSSTSANKTSKRWHPHFQTAGSTTSIFQGSVATVLKWASQK